MCASLWRPTNTWSSDSLSIHLPFHSPRPCSPPLSFFLTPAPPSPHFLLSKFISLQVPSTFFFPPPSPPPRSFPRCLSPPPLPPNAVRLTTLFPFKIKIIKSAAKWERVCAAGVTMQRFDVLFQRDSINIYSSVPKLLLHTLTHNHTYGRTIHAFTPHIPSTHRLLQYAQRHIRHAKLYCLSSYFLSPNHGILHCWSHPLLFLLSFPLQTSPSLSLL